MVHTSPPIQHWVCHSPITFRPRDMKSLKSSECGPYIPSYSTLSHSPATSTFGDLTSLKSSGCGQVNLTTLNPYFWAATLALLYEQKGTLFYSKIPPSPRKKVTLPSYEKSFYLSKAVVVHLWFGSRRGSMGRLRPLSRFARDRHQTKERIIATVKIIFEVWFDA